MCLAKSLHEQTLKRSAIECTGIIKKQMATVKKRQTARVLFLQRAENLSHFIHLGLNEMYVHMVLFRFH